MVLHTLCPAHNVLDVKHRTVTSVPMFPSQVTLREISARPIKWMMLALLVVAFVSLFVVPLVSGDAFVVDAMTGVTTIPKSCLHVCKQGACQFRDCDYPQCPGGACHFINCRYPSCAGGGCIFESSTSATCNGGSCTFRDPSETLKAGYCDGGNCNIDGKPHPDLQSHLTI